MKDLNLLPQEYQGKSPAGHWFVLFLILCLSVWPVVNYGFLKPLRTRSEKKQLLTSARTQTGQPSVLEKDYEQQQAKLEEWQDRISAFHEMEEEAPQSWRNRCDVLMDSLPHGVSIQEITCDGTTVVVSGSSPDEVLLAEYLRNLKDSGFFSEVRMERILYRDNKEVAFHLYLYGILDFRKTKEETS